MECRYKLATFGIPIDAFPIGLGGELIPYAFRRDIERMAEEERGKPPSKNIVVTSRDILHGRGPVVFNFPGNQMLANVVSRNLHAYQSKSKSERGTLLSDIGDHFHRNGARFLVKTKEHTWRLATDKEIRDKVSHTFRNRKAEADRSDASMLQANMSNN